jgi:hypothetical protein
MEFAALLEGCRRVVRPAAASDDAIAIRPIGSGRPDGGYRGGGWFFGVYFTGAQPYQGQSVESYSLTMSVGVDITRVLATVPSKRLGEWWVKEGEILGRAAFVCRLMNQSYSVVARSCNAAMSEMCDNQPDGVFREKFSETTASAVRVERPDWVGEDNDNERAPVVWVCSLKFSGLKFHALLSEMPTS